MSTEVRPNVEKKLPTTEELAVRYRQRITEMFIESLEDPNAVQANLGAGASQMMLMASLLGQLIQETMSEKTGSLGDFRKLVGPIDTFQKLMRQVDRLVGLQARLNRDTKSS